MLSILIPTYNYDCFSLVKELKNQADTLEIIYEIIVQDDFSQHCIDENSKINSLHNCRFQINTENLGRTKNRTNLVKNAKFDLILFLDADVYPEKNTFLKDYLETYKKEKKIIFGGYKYTDAKPDASKILRYKYGKAREERPSEIRNIKPYSYVFSGNILVEKSVFLIANFNEDRNLYGMDIFFSYNLFKSKTPIIHIDNAIFHNGLENNDVFFYKNLESVDNRKRYLSEEKDISKVNSLLKYYLLIKKLKIEKIVYWLFLKFEKKLKKSILSENPNLLYMDLYRLGYICNENKN